MHAADPKQAARKAEASPTVRRFARAGYVANGVVHVLIGVIVLVIATGGDASSDQSGAFMAIASAPLGFVALWALAICLWALGIWHFFEGMLVRNGEGDAASQAKKWGRRASEWGQAFVFMALGGVAASVALGARANGEAAAEGASREALSIPGGGVVLGLVGLGVGIGGVAFIVMGVLRSFRKKMSIPSGTLGVTVTALGVAGFVAKGVALAIVGVLLVVAAVSGDAAVAGGLDGAIQALLGVAYGTWLVGTVGFGFIAYGVFCMFRARFARL